MGISKPHMGKTCLRCNKEINPNWVICESCSNTHKECLFCQGTLTDDTVSCDACVIKHLKELDE